MNDGLIPGRYAKALLKVAQERGEASTLYDLMRNLDAAFLTTQGLAQTIANPFVAPDQKDALLTTAAGATASDTLFADFLKLLRRNNRTDFAAQAAHSYTELYRRANHIYKVDVTSAAPMAPEAEERLKSLISSHLPQGSTMEYSFHVNPDLIGGFTIDIGSERLDASIRNDLKQLEHRLLS